MTLERFKNLRPRDYEQYLQYIFMEVSPEDVGSKDNFQDNFERWLAAQEIEEIIRHADSYAGLLVSYNTQT